MWRKKADRVVAPVVRETKFHQVEFIDKLVDWQKFYSGDSARDKMLNHGRVTDTSVGTALVFWNARMKLRESFDVCLVNNRIAPRGIGRLVRAPVERGVNEH